MVSKSRVVQIFGKIILSLHSEENIVEISLSESIPY
jgi:hypothetical protein